MEVKVKRSPRRKKTISARLIGGVMHVLAPHHLPENKLQESISKLKDRLLKKEQKKELDSKASLYEIAEKLNQKYFGGQIKIGSIEYSTKQKSVFGNCSTRRGAIRLSHRLASMPGFVRDYVIIHEMCHIIHPNHKKDFKDLVARYELAERARGFLMAKGFEMNDESEVLLS